MIVANKKVLVLKFGTASITKENGEPNEVVIEQIAAEVSDLHKEYSVIIVSSGAVGAGKRFIKNYKGDLSQRKAAAAIGNLALIGIYADKFSKYGLQVAQSLCERGHFADRQKFLQLKSTYRELWKNGIIPIANENDVVSSRELQFSDNDELATIIAAGFGAEKLMLCTKSGGLLDHEKKIIPKVSGIDKEIFGLVDNSMSTSGLGGMASKLTFTRKAVAVGIEVVIFGISDSCGIQSALTGESGTTFEPHKTKVSARNKWLASGSITVAQIRIDNGAKQAILKRKSLLAVGVTAIYGEFQIGEFVEIIDEDSAVVGIARSRIYAGNFERNTNSLVAHADDIVFL